ncbi:MAG: hypothetical protein QMD95_04120 [Candidatus Hodarchaeaceae archaeon]|nr:hypothetical protein [Candidatus Hodarchaeaceae archaeon]
MITSYSIAKRYNEVLNALEHDVVEARMGFFGRVLACQTLRFGKFSLRYKPRTKYSPAFYELRVPTSKALPPKEMISFKPSRGFVWELDELDSLDVSEEIEERMKKSLETGAWSLKEDSQLFEKLPMERLKQLRSLIYIKTEKGAHENAWVARFDDKWLYSETPDIIECMKILREVEWKL